MNEDVDNRLIDSLTSFLDACSALKNCDTDDSKKRCVAFESASENLLAAFDDRVRNLIQKGKQQ